MKDLLKAFPDRSCDSIRSRAGKLGLVKDVGYGGRFEWTKERCDFLRKHYPSKGNEWLSAHLGCSQQAIYGQAYTLGVKKDPAYMEKLQVFFNENLVKAGEKTRFKSGHKSWNKGKDPKDYLSPEQLERIKAGWFKPGGSPHNEKCDGAIVIRKDTKSGIKYLYIRTAPGEWQLLNRYVWEKETGETLGRDDYIRYKDGDQFNCKFENLEKVNRKENLYRNQMSDSSIVRKFIGVSDKELQQHILKNYPEIIELTRNQIKLKHKINSL